MDRLPERLALDIPERLVDAAQNSRLDGAAAVEGTTMDGLPVMHDAVGILADEIISDLQSPRGAGLGVVL